MNFNRAYFGQGTGRIVLDNVRCAGTEHDLMECSHNEVIDHYCDHEENAAGVACTSEQYFVLNHHCSKTYTTLVHNTCMYIYFSQLYW